MDSGEVADRREVIARRAELVELLKETGPSRTRDIVDNLDDSRSTVNRALGELTDAGFVEKRGSEYAITTTGALAVDEFRRHQRTSHAIFRLNGLLDSVPDSESIPTEFLVDGHASLVDDTEPFVPVEKVAARIQRAKSVKAYLPTLVSPHLLRTWHQAVTSQDVGSTAIFSTELSETLQEQYPRLLIEMDEYGYVSTAPDIGLPYGLILTEHDKRTTVSVIVYQEDHGVRGTLHNDSESAVMRAYNMFDWIEENAVSVSDTLDELSASLDNPTMEKSLFSSNEAAKSYNSETKQAGKPLPPSLNSQGFIRLSAEYFNNHSEASPEVSWRTGFTLPEVRAGHTVERVNAEGQNIVGELVQELQNGKNHVVLGPPGVGKSTSCMTVACEWYDRQLGPVLYRPRGDGDSFTSSSLLKGYLRQTEGHTLVVVEDGIREEANEIIDVMQSLDGREDVTFLLDSREGEWYNVDDFTLDPRLNAYRRTAIQKTTIPELDRRSCRRFISKIEQLTGTEAELSSSDLHTRITDERDKKDPGEPSPGSALLAQSHLLRNTAAGAGGDNSSPNALEAHVQETFRSLDETSSELAVELGVLVSLLDAAGLTVTNEYLHALVRGDEHGKIEQALSSAEGEILFGKKKTRARQTEYRTHHETWSRLFLEQLLKLRPEAEAIDTFGSCVSRLIKLSTDSDHRAEIERHISGQTPHISRIEANPESWVETVVKRIFELGVSHSRLAPLYGRARDENIDIPEVCSAYTRHRMCFKRAKMNGFAGRFRLGKEEAEHLKDIDSSTADVNETEAAKLRFFGHYAIAKFHRIISQQDSAHDHAKQARDAAQSIGDIEKEAKAQLELVRIEYSRNDSKAGRPYLDELQTLTDQHNFRGLEAVALTTHGRQLVAQGDRAAAEDQLQDGLKQAQATNRPQEIALAQHALGLLSCDAANFEDAETRLVKGLERVQVSGNTIGQTALSATLAQVKRKTGDLPTAESLLNTAIEKSHGNPEFESFSYWVRAGVAADRGDHPGAVEDANRAVQLAEEGGHSHFAARGYCLLTRVAITRHEYERAEDYLEQARGKCRELGNDLLLATCDRLQARLECQRGSYEDAMASVRDALDPLEEEDITGELADCLYILGICELANNDIASAKVHLNRGLSIASEGEVVRVIGELHEALGYLKSERGEAEAASKHRTCAKSRFNQLNNEDRAQSVDGSPKLL